MCPDTNTPQLTLVSTETFHSPIVGIMNEGGPDNSFIFLTPGRHTWARSWTQHIHYLSDRAEDETDSETGEDESLRSSEEDHDGE